MKNLNTLTLISVCALFAWSGSTFAQHSAHHQSAPTAPADTAAKASPYAGEPTRAIKSLSASDVSSLQNGAGMAYAKTAELNRYPGPMHVLELASRLQLSAEQRSATTQLLAQHKAKALELGAQLVDAQRALDYAFVSKQIDAQRITELTQHIGVMQATLRAEHLRTRLAQTARLNPEQIASYQSLRGYDKADGASHPHTQ